MQDRQKGVGDDEVDGKLGTGKYNQMSLNLTETSKIYIVRQRLFCMPTNSYVSLHVRRNSSTSLSAFHLPRWLTFCIVQLYGYGSP